ncbi:MAG: hypothetical protein ACYC99_06870 [Candidatus Geothermincolia bacterium]
MRATIVIPSYWSRMSNVPFDQKDVVYDHPTPLDMSGTLERALESIKILKNRDFNVVVLACSTATDIQAMVEEKVDNIVMRFKDQFPVVTVSHSFEAQIKERLVDAGRDGAGVDPETVSLSGYSNIRNMCLIVTELMGSEAAVLLDDDEIYEDPEYLDKVFENIGTQHEGKFVGALAGYYQRPDGSFLLPPPEEWYMSEWPMVRSMNEAFRIISEEPRLKPTPWVFGGNMVIHRDIFRKISFDPHVRRGEDIDYLTNCKFFDIDFLLDRELAIKHLPPKTHIPAWAHFRENIYRFVYAREKLRRQVPTEGLRHVEVSELDPYPGRCMTDDLEDLIFKTCTLMGFFYLRQISDRGPVEVGFQETMNNFHIARFDAMPENDPFLWYLDFRTRWERLMEFLSGDKELAGALQARL